MRMPYTPRSTMTPYIQPSATWHAPLLRRDIADVIPMSTRNFATCVAHHGRSHMDDVGHLREPATYQGREEDVRHLPGVTRGNTHDLRALSSSDVPAEGDTSGRKYNVIVAQKDAESSKTMTCHGMGFPFRAFMCHAMNPTKTYEVTLESEDHTSRMVVLAVSHVPPQHVGVQPREDAWARQARGRASLPLHRQGQRPLGVGCSRCGGCLTAQLIKIKISRNYAGRMCAWLLRLFTCVRLVDFVCLSVSLMLLFFRTHIQTLPL
jgi:hypothetical protein